MRFYLRQCPENDSSKMIALNSWVICYVQDKFRIQIRVSEAPIGSFQFVLLHVTPQDYVYSRAQSLESLVIFRMIYVQDFVII